jgi:hypothetical protein
MATWPTLRAAVRARCQALGVPFAQVNIAENPASVATWLARSGPPPAAKTMKRFARWLALHPVPDPAAATAPAAVVPPAGRAPEVALPDATFPGGPAGNGASTGASGPRSGPGGVAHSGRNGAAQLPAATGGALQAGAGTAGHAAAG